ncbi:unnamed protein product [Rotaria magnacalcarata]
MAMEHYYKLLDDHIQSLNSKFREKFSIKQSLYDDIILVLRDGWGNSQLKFWVHKNFKLIKNGDQDLVYEIKSNCPIVTYENMYMKIQECHERVAHQGRDQTWLHVKGRYSWIPIYCVKLFISQCNVCLNKKNFLEPITVKPVVSIGYLTRLQIELIDMRNIQDGEYKWILHTMDHFTKFSWAYPLKSKEAKSVADKLLQQFYSFGTPRILQSDNGKEFVAKVIKELKTNWIDLTIINGRSQDSQTHAFVEHNNQILKLTLYKWIQLNNCENWSKGLAQVVYSINSSSAQSIKITPYEKVFGPKSRYDIDIRQFLSTQDVVNEEDLPQDAIDKLKEYENQTNVVETTTPLNIKNSLTSLSLVPQISLDLTLPTVLSSKIHMSPQMKNKQRSELLANEQIESNDTEKESNSRKAYSICNNQRLRSETEAMDMTITFKRRKLFHDALHQY